MSFRRADLTTPRIATDLASREVQATALRPHPTGKAPGTVQPPISNIRCRRCSDREVQENSLIILSSDLEVAKSKEISIECAVCLQSDRDWQNVRTSIPESSFCRNNEHSKQVYNTMQGDFTSTPIENPSPNAGAIPRVLFRLFNQLGLLPFKLARSQVS